MIAPISDEAIKLFAKIGQANQPDRPLLVLLSDSPTKAQPADLTVSTDWLPSTLPAALKLHAENRKLRQTVAAADERADRRDAEHKRSTEEIHLLKNAIVRTVSHELKTPMLQVKAAVAMLVDERVEDRAALVDYAMGATTRLENVIKNVTQLAESLEIDLQPAQVSDSVAQAVRNLRRSWENRNQVERIQIDVPNDLPFVLADKQGIGIVLQLLLDNALKFSKLDVKVTAEATGDGVLVAVHDSGIGIASDQLETIFDLFYQIDHSETRRFGGVGVGLTIVRLILEQHHATIKVESALKEGSIFSFTLPYFEG